MALGAYSIVRYSNNLSDQRVNIGVLVWHPNDGFAHRFSPSLDRIQAVNPLAHIRPIRDQLSSIKSELDRSGAASRATLEELANLFKVGIEITAPCPARIVNAENTLERLYVMLVSPVPEIRRASSQRQFEWTFGKILRRVLGEVHPNSQVEDLGTLEIEGFPVTIGFRTTVKHRRILWRPLSLQSLDTPEKQLVGAKAAAMDVATTRGVREYRADRHVVAVQQPKLQSSERLGAVVACLRKVADDVLVGADGDAIAHQIPDALAAR